MCWKGEPGDQKTFAFWVPLGLLMALLILGLYPALVLDSLNSNWHVPMER